MTSRLKTIELQGYKTFANKVAFEFPLPITAIVGPNGSGKSNISDAIRWVLGEQSFSLLRGRKTMDMIFSGSDKKSRSSMASATILFDNSDQWLPIDYQEVSVTRRAFRDGQNDYLINGQKVRLKDVNELLAQSGLSERTYTIIGQGLIDNALSAKPEDRRKFFEEAAGIGLFRSRREEALNRLSETHHNMERIGDILSELEPRVHSLERQAKRASEYESITADLKLLLRDWYGFHWHRSQQDLLIARERNQAQEEKTEQTRQEFASLEKNNSEIQEEVRLSRQKLSELHAQSSEAHLKLEQFNRDSAILDERSLAIQSQIRNYQDESENLTEEAELIDERKGELVSELDEQKANAQEAETQKAQFEQDLAARQEELRGMKNDLHGKRNDLATLEANLIRTKARRDELTNRSDNLQTSLITLQNTLEQTERGMRNFAAENEKFISVNAENESRLSALNEKVEKLRQQSDTLENQQRELNVQKTHIESERSKYSARCDVLNDAEQNLSGLNQGAQYLMKNARQGRIHSKIISLEGRMVVAKDYELAAAAALGDNLDALLIDRSEWNFVMDLLNSGNNGRAVLIPEEYQSRHSLLCKNEALHDISPILNFIQCESAMQTLLERVLGNVWLAQNRADALRLQSELLPGQTLVTRNGEIFRADGSVISGNEGKHQLLSRTRELQELRAESARLENQYQEYADRLAQIEDLLKQTRQDQDAAIKEQRQSQANQVQIQKKLNQIAIENEKQKQTAAFQRQRLEEAQKQISELTQQIERSQATITNLEQQRDIAQTAIREAQNLVNQIQLGELQDQAHHWSVSLAVLQKSILEMEKRIQDNEDQMVKNRSRQTANTDRIYALEKQIEEIAQKKTDVQDDSAELNTLTEQLNAQISPAEVLLKNAEEKMFRSQEDFQNFQQRVTLAERLLAQTQLEVTRQDDKLESLKKRIEEDFGLVDFTYKDQISGQSTLPLGDMVADLPQIDELQENLEGQIQQRKNHLRRMGAVNFEAVAEFKETSERFNFLTTQLNDLKKADSDLREVINELDTMMENSFQNTFDKVQKEFKLMFSRLFDGGSAKLLLTDPEDVNSSGIEIEAKLPGHREQELSLLSGGERSLTSVALVFALLRVSPTPFCVLDEVDAALDEANVGRFCELLKDLSKDTQFLVITHNRNTVEASDVIYGVTMASDSTSQVVSLKLDEVSKDILK